MTLPVAPQDQRLDYLSFVDAAVVTAAARVPDLDTAAMRVVLLLHRTDNAVIGDIEGAAHRPAGWSFPGFRLLFALWVAGPLGGSRLAELSGVSRAAVSTLGQRLERDGLIARAPSATDARSIVLSLTATGQARLERAFSEHHRREQRWAGRLDPGEQAELIRLLHKLGDGGAPI